MTTIHKFFIGLLLLLTSSCGFQTSDKKEIAPERQAPSRVEESFQKPTSSNQLTIKKDSLGKAFLLVASLRTSGRYPQFLDLQPQVVSFERSGSQLGLFYLDYGNVYDNISTDRLLQTFPIISETSDEIVFDLSKGIRSINQQNFVQIVEPSSFADIYSKVSNGLETAIEMKEAFIRKTEMRQNSLHIEQVARIKTTQLEESQITPFKEPSKSKSYLKQEEVSSTFFFEILPYQANAQFKSKLMDVEQRVGFFINLNNKPGDHLPEPQIVRWDISSGRDPITVGITEDTPTEVIDAIKGGVEYWNRILETQAFKVVTQYPKNQLPQNRMVIIRWINWENAGFAYASIQSDPLSGEILRGQIFLTSSMVAFADMNMSLPMAHNDKIVGPLKVGNTLCVRNFDLKDLQKSVYNLKPERRKKVAMDFLRHIVAHEMGHVVGLRHNFAGSKFSHTADEDFHKSLISYLEDENSSGYKTSSTVMDYLSFHAAAMDGAHAQTGRSSYDEMATAWAYKDAPLNIERGQYCSDEHLMYAELNHRSVYGCLPGDLLKNPLAGSLKSAKDKIENAPQLTFQTALSSTLSPSPYTPSEMKEVTNSSYNFEMTELEKMIYSADDHNPYQTITSAVESYIRLLVNLPQTPHRVPTPSPMTSTYPDNDFQAELEKDSAQVGGLSRILDELIPKDPELAQKTTRELFDNLDPAIMDRFRPEHYQKLIEASFKAAKEFDNTVEVKILTSLVPVKEHYDYSMNNSNEKGDNAPKKKLVKFNSYLKLGDTKSLMQRYRLAIVKRESPRTVTVKGKQIEIRNISIPFMNKVLNKAFVLENWTLQHQQAIKADLEVEKELLKKDILANSIALIEASGLTVPSPITHAAVTETLSKVNWDEVVGLPKMDPAISQELLHLMELENLKADSL